MNQNIEGLPPGVKVSGFCARMSAPTSRGEVRLGTLDMAGAKLIVVPIPAVWRTTENMLDLIPIIEPDNVYGVLDLNAVPIPAGYERGPFDVPSADEEWLGHVSGTACPHEGLPTSGDRRRIILRKVNRTKRVLVAEWDCDGMTPNFDFPDASAFAVTKPARHRYEEREIPQPCAPIEDDAPGDDNLTRLRGQPLPPRGEEGPQPCAADRALREFRMYCEKHPELRFWQALAPWSGSVKILSERFQEPHRDTFHWKGRNG